MDITTVTVVNGGVSSDYTSLTQEQKKHLVGKIVQGAAVPNIEIPAAGGNPALKMQGLTSSAPAGSAHTPASIAFTFECPLNI